MWPCEDVEGDFFPELVRVLLVQLPGENYKHEQVLSLHQVAIVKVVSAEASFEGDPKRFCLGIEVVHLGLAYEHAPASPQVRLLLAEDAGNTIVAGLLPKELKLRGFIHRTPIVVPADLVFQWQRELRDCFRECFDGIRGVNPWQDEHQVISSTGWAKRGEVLESLQCASWDLVIVDEYKTDRYRLGEVLSQKIHRLPVSLQGARYMQGQSIRAAA